MHVAMQRQVELIGAAWGLGGVDAGCAEAPTLLAPLVQVRLRERGVAAMFGPMLSPLPMERRRNVAIGRLCRRLAAAVADARRAGRLPCVIGGDHTCAAGTWSGVASTLDGPSGLVWIDAHMDSHTPATSPSGRLHGMPLAWLLGEHDQALCGLGAAVLQPANVCLVGVRSFEPAEAKRLERLGVRVFFMDEIRLRGLGPVFLDALRLASERTAGFGITIDLDAIAPEEAPGVATPAPGGLPAGELVAALGHLRGESRLAALELVEYCPRLDRDGRTARLAVELLVGALCGPRENAQILAEALQRVDR